MDRRARFVTVLAFLAGLPATAAPVRAQPARGLDVSKPVTYFIEEGRPGSGFEAHDRTLARWALEAWGREADPALVLTPGPEASAAIRVYWVRADEGLFGETRARTVAGRPAADVFVSASTEGLGRDIASGARVDTLFRDTIVYLTCVHELGHAFGLPHTDAFADIMYSFVYGGDFVAYFMRFRRQLRAFDDIQRASPFSPADRAAFRAVVSAARGG